MKRAQSRARRPAEAAAFGAILGVALAAAGGARADTGEATWTTYLYQGPGYHYSVAAEVPQGQHFDVAECKDGWCRISFEGRFGYVRQTIVALGNPAANKNGLFPQPAAAMVAHPEGPCVQANQKGGNGGNAMNTFCQKK